MLRGLLFLVIIGLVAYVILTMFRRSSRGRQEAAPPPPPQAVQAPPPALAAPPAAASPDALTTEQALHKLNEVAFSRGLQNTTPAHPEIIEAVGSVLSRAATDPRYAVRRPTLLPQLMSALRDSDTSRRELATMIAKDPALVGGLLKLANSPFYRVNAQPVESVDRAVAVIGTEGIRSLIAAALIQPVFRVAGGDFANFPEVIWEHSFLAASAAETYAAVVVNSDPFAAQLLALVNGLGSIVVFRASLDQYALREHLKPDAATIVALLDMHSASVARNIAASWDLSGRILAALEDQVSLGMATDPTPLGRSLRFGRFIGALAVLNAKGVISDEVAHASLLANGAAGAHFERIWERLTGKPPKPADGAKRPVVSAWNTAGKR
jgi:HD-like signal output (HDOD) protein